MLRLICICLFLVGCATNTANVAEKSQNSFVQNPDLKWTRVQAQILNDTQKAQKVNLLGKCYYLEDNKVCETILAQFNKECNAGVGLSCGMLIVASKDARGVSRDPKKTLSYMRHGCYFNDELSCMYMRQHYLSDNQTQEADKILKHIQTQCDKGGVFECFLLSLVYENNDSFEKQREHILEYRKRACDKEFAIACAYMDSKSLSKQDYEHYQEVACELGMLAACDARRESIELNSRMQHGRLYRIW